MPEKDNGFIYHYGKYPIPGQRVIPGIPSQNIVSFGSYDVVGLQCILAVAKREFPDIGIDKIELRIGSNAIEMRVYEKLEGLSPIEGPTIGLRGGQFVWGKNCRVSLKEVILVAHRYFPDEDETGGVVLFSDKYNCLVMEPC